MESAALTKQGKEKIKIRAFRAGLRVSFDGGMRGADYGAQARRGGPVLLRVLWPPFDPNFDPFGGFFFDIGLGGSHSSGFNYKGLEASGRVDKRVWKA